MTVSQIMYLPLLSIFPNFLDICIACYSHRLATCCCNADRLCQVYLLHPTICLIRYLIRHINFPLPQLREYLHYWMTVFCANFYISFNFFNIPTLFLNLFTAGFIGMQKSLKSCGFDGSCLYFLKGINFFLTFLR